VYVTFWRFFHNRFAVETQQCIVCVVFDDDELRVTVKYLKILTIAQQCFLW